MGAGYRTVARGVNVEVRGCSSGMSPGVQVIADRRRGGRDAGRGRPGPQSSPGARASGAPRGVRRSQISLRADLRSRTALSRPRLSVPTDATCPGVTRDRRRIGATSARTDIWDELVGAHGRRARASIGPPSSRGPLRRPRGRPRAWCGPRDHHWCYWQGYWPPKRRHGRNAAESGGLSIALPPGVIIAATSRPTAVDAARLAAR